MMSATHSEIIVTKVTKNIYNATTTIFEPMKAEVNMKGRSEEIAKKKMELFLANKPYKHLDDL